MNLAAVGCATDLQGLEVMTKIRCAPECRFQIQTALQDELRGSGNVEA